MRIPTKLWTIIVLGSLLSLPPQVMANPHTDSAISGRIQRSNPHQVESHRTLKRDEQEQSVTATEDPQEDEIDTDEAVDERPATRQEPAYVTTSNSVARAAFTSNIANREPVDTLEHLPLEADEIYFFTELAEMHGETVVHRWEYNGEIHAEVAFDVDGPHWRVWSRKGLLPSWAGTWTVVVVNLDGDILHQASFDYSDAE